ncbi:MAG TPA: hypothetical protein DCE43_07860 [Planctomycetaceae bacterium]|nr:hypothetical protein [Planctomycetaceae bacterium]
MKKTTTAKKSVPKKAAKKKASKKTAAKKTAAPRKTTGSTRKTATTRETTTAGHNYDVFISFKTHDTDAARLVYDALRDRGVSVFFSAESIITQGAGNYSSAIEMALDASRVLVLVGSCVEHIQSTYVRAEWDAFLNDIRSDHKPHGELFVLNCGTLEPRQLPLFLRCHNMFALDDLDALINSVVNALPAPPALGDVITSCLRFRDNTSDKLYLLTVTEAPNGSFTVASHWGRRESQRLKSQVKDADCPDRRTANEKARQYEQEKKRKGYRKARWPRVLTAQARLALGAALHLTMNVEK